LNNPDPIAKHPVAWLQPMPDGYKIPLWRWILLPATALMLKRNQGVWVSGELMLFPDRIQFVQSKMIKTRSGGTQWELSLAKVIDITKQKGIASETIEIHSTGGTLKLMTVRSDDFIAQLNQAIQRVEPATCSDPTSTDGI